MIWRHAGSSSSISSGMPQSSSTTCTSTPLDKPGRGGRTSRTTHPIRASTTATGPRHSGSTDNASTASRGRGAVSTLRMTRRHLLRAGFVAGATLSAGTVLPRPLRAQQPKRGGILGCATARSRRAEEEPPASHVSALRVQRDDRVLHADRQAAVQRRPRAPRDLPRRRSAGDRRRRVPPGRADARDRPRAGRMVHAHRSAGRRGAILSPRPQGGAPAPGRGRLPPGPEDPAHRHGRLWQRRARRLPARPAPAQGGRHRGGAQGAGVRGVHGNDLRGPSFDIQRYAAEQQYYVYLYSPAFTGSWRPYVKNYAPNPSFDYGNRVAALWLDR